MGKVENKAIFGRMMLTYHLNHWNPILLAHIKLLVPFFCNEPHFIPCSAAGIYIYPSQTLIVVSSCITATKQATGTCELLGFGCTFTNPCNSSIAQAACAEYIITSNASFVTDNQSICQPDGVSDKPYPYHTSTCK
jgi:hypothetical protein